MSRSIESYYKSNNPADAVLSLRNFCSDFGEISSGNDRARQVSQLQIISARCSALGHVAAGDSPAKRAQARGPSPGRRVACRYVSLARISSIPSIARFSAFVSVEPCTPEVELYPPVSR